MTSYWYLSRYPKGKLSMLRIIRRNLKTIWRDIMLAFFTSQCSMAVIRYNLNLLQKLYFDMCFFSSVEFIYLFFCLNLTTDLNVVYKLYKQPSYMSKCSSGSILFGNSEFTKFISMSKGPVGN